MTSDNNAAITKRVQSPKAYIQAITTHLPQNLLTTQELHRQFPEWGVEKIESKTGIKIRGISGVNETASDLGVQAAQKLFDQGICKPQDIDFLIFCTQSPDYFLPTTACLIQSRLGLSTSCGAFDFNLGCSGFVYGLSIAKGLIETGTVNKILLITAETYSKYLDPKDRSTRTIFSDGAAATLIESKMSHEEGIGPFIFGTDGRGAQELIVPMGGHRIHDSKKNHDQQNNSENSLRSPHHLFMNGPEIFNFTLNTIPSCFNDLLKKSSKKIEDFDLIIPHQANRFMLEQLRRKMNIPVEKFFNNLENYGNTVSSTIPMALEIALNEKRIFKGSHVALMGFGVGYSWAACQVRF